MVIKTFEKGLKTTTQLYINQLKHKSKTLKNRHLGCVNKKLTWCNFNKKKAKTLDLTCFY